jgi:hypothetical protein
MPGGLVRWYVGNNGPDDLRVVDTELNVVLGNSMLGVGQRLFG